MEPAQAPVLSKRVRVLNLCVIGFLVLALIGIEWHFRGLLASRPLANYEATLYSSKGEQLGPWRGNLRVEMSPYTVYRNAPNQTHHRYTTDEYGFRGPRVDLSEKTGTRVFLLGGSAAFGVLAATDSATIMGRMGEFRPGWNVVNAAVTGFLSGQELSELVHTVSDFEPDVVIVLDGWNDLFVTWFGEERTEREFGYSNNHFAIERQLRQHRLAQERFGHASFTWLRTTAMKSAFIEWLFTNEPAPAGERSVPIGVDDASKDENYFNGIRRTYVRNLGKMADFCRARNIRFLAALQPEIGTRMSLVKMEVEFKEKNPLYFEVFPDLYRRFCNSVENARMLADVRIVNLNNDESLIHAEKPVFVDWVHFSTFGNIRVARILAEETDRLLAVSDSE